ncbi:MAG: tRNA nucleotidyltransferase, partial [Bacteroidota bacterium]
MNLATALKADVFSHLKQVAQQQQTRAYLIGGFVRDVILDRPCKDIDVVVEGKGIELARAFGEAV